MYRWAEAAETDALVALWHEVFGDEEAYARQGLKGFAGFGNIYVSENEAGAVEAMLLAVPCRIGFEQGVYLYALATTPSARGSGVMSGLMTFAERRATGGGAVFSALIPASEALFAYYRKRGYTQDIVLRYLDKTVEPNVQGMADFSRILPEQFARLRERYARGPVLNFSADRMALIVADLYESGARTVQTLDGYAVYYEQEGRLLVAELMAKSDEAADGVLGALAQQTGLHRMVLSLPAKGGAYAGQGVPRAAAVIKALEPGADVTNVYLRFAMDEVPDSFS